ncbi:MAG: membrane protein insertion efficiency factor YidD [Ruminococcus sp.]|nr:membrane protein insertion efficiency factor YidD [Ruminococcus sp.]
MKHLLILLVKFYRKFISPLFPPCCKYYPTCSTYALQAIERFGAFRGILLAIWRLLRCNPWSMGGIDYVPEKFTFRIKKYDYTSCECCSQHYDDKDNQN